MKTWYMGRAYYDLGEIRRHLRHSPQFGEDERAHSAFIALLRYSPPDSFLTTPSPLQPDCFAVDVEPLRFHVQTVDGDLWVLMVEEI